MKSADIKETVSKDKELFENLFRYSDIPVAVFSFDKELVFYNDSFAQRNCIFDSTDNPVLDKNEVALTFSKCLTSIITGLKNQDNCVIEQWECDFNVYKSELGETPYIIAMGQNSNELQKIVVSKTESETELKNKNSIKDKIFSIIAHDLKNPVGTIEQVSEVLHKHLDDFSQDEIKDYIHDIYITSKSTSSLLQTLLDWSHVQKGTAQFEPTEMDLNMIAEKCKELLSIKARHKNIEIINEVSPSTNAFGDPRLIYTVLRNLITNSLKFTQKGGNIRVSTTKIDDSFIQLSVIDTGVGMPSNKAENLFAIEGIESTNGTDEESGTGLGLMLSKDFIEMHQCKIWAESIEGHGTTIHFTVPKIDIFNSI